MSFFPSLLFLAHDSLQDALTFHQNRPDEHQIPSINTYKFGFPTKQLLLQAPHIPVPSTMMVLSDAMVRTLYF